jgi:hypothetical protein
VWVWPESDDSSGSSALCWHPRFVILEIGGFGDAEFRGRIVGTNFGTNFHEQHYDQLKLRRGLG